MTKRRVRTMISAFLVFALVSGNAIAYSEGQFLESREAAEARANQEYTELLTAWGLEEGDVSYPEFYAGAYINDDGNLVVRTVDANEGERAELKRLTGNANLIIDTCAVYSYEQLTELKDQIIKQHRLGAKDLGVHNNLKALRILDDKNILQIELKEVSQEAIAEFYDEYIPTANMRTEENWNEGLHVRGAIEFVCKNDADGLKNVEVDKAKSEKATVERTTTLLLEPGAEIHVFSGGVWQGIQSIGFPCQKNGAAGFITAAHGMGSAAVASTARTGGTVFADAAGRQYNGTVDATFADCRDGASISYTFTFKTGLFSSETRTFTGITAIAQNSTIHKVGATTKYTSGTVISTNASATVDGSNIMITDLIETDMDASGGDSGGAVFTKVGTSNAYIVGIVHAGNNVEDVRYMVKVHNIKAGLSLTISFPD